MKEEKYPEYADLLRKPSARSHEAILTSVRIHEKLLGPLWGQRVVGSYVLVWASDVLLTLLSEKNLDSSLARRVQEQKHFLRQHLGRPKVILCIHDPHALAYIPTHVFSGWDFPPPLLTIAGHLHMPWLRWTLPRRLRQAFRLVICPSLTGNRLAAGGGFLVGEAAGEILSVFRYRLSSGRFSTVW